MKYNLNLIKGNTGTYIIQMEEEGKIEKLAEVFSGEEDALLIYYLMSKLNSEDLQSDNGFKDFILNHAGKIPLLKLPQE